MSKESTEIPINRTKAAPRRRVRKLTFWEKHVAAVTFMGVVIGILVGAYGLYLVWEVEPNYQVIISPPDQEQQEYVLTYGSYPEMTQPDFFDNTLKQFKEQRSSFLEADLVNKEIRVFKDGKVEFEAPIAAKGRAGSWWETPAGLYEVQTKSPNHFSRLASVHMPWSIQFHGNFFIHGWPYHPDGRPLSSQFTGGCIRLNNDDAQQLYQLAKPGMPVLVHNRPPEDGLTYSTEPQVSADSLLVADLKNDFVFFEEGQNQTFPMSSFVHSLTALVGVEHINLGDSYVHINDDMLTETPRERLQAGERLSFYQLLFPLLMESSNEAARAAVSTRGEKLFVNWLNSKARALGMEQTEINGITSDSDNLTSLYDLYRFTHHVYLNRRFVLEISALQDGAADWKSVYGSPAWDDLENLHPLSRTDNFRGGARKTADPRSEEPDSYTLSAVYQVKINGHDRPLIFLLRGSEDPEQDIEKMKNSIISTYSLKEKTEDDIPKEKEGWQDEYQEQ